MIIPIDMLEFQQNGGFVNNHIELLSKVPLFENIEPDEIEVILSRLDVYVRKYNKDQYIRRSGDPADFIGIILEGEIQILQDDYYGNRSITATFGRGSLFAEAFACSGIMELPVDILACSNAEILFINKGRLLHTCNHSCTYHHSLISNLLGIVSRKNLVLNQKLQYSAHKTTREKLMAYLNVQAKQHHSLEFDIPFDRQALADYLGVERSAMSAEIGKLVKLGYIETRRSHFKLFMHPD